MENAKFMRTCAVWCGIGSLITLVVGIINSIPDYVRSAGLQMPRQYVLIILHVMVLAGLLGLGRSGAIGTSMAGRVALGVALLGQAILTLAEAVWLVDPKNTAQVLFAVAVLLIVVGMIATGIVVLRVKRWHGWHAWTPLLWGLYPVVFTPIAAVFGMFGVQVEIAFWSVCSLLFSVALWQEAGERKAIQPSLTGVVR